MQDKGISNPAQSDKDMVPDYDDGMLFFHSHSLWDAMAKLEKFYQCKIYGYLDIQEMQITMISMLLTKIAKTTSAI